MGESRNLDNWDVLGRKLGSMVRKWVISYNLYTTYTSTYIINDVILGVKLTHWILSFY